MMNTDSLQAVLREHGLLEGQADWTALSGGRTNRVWSVGDGKGKLICKLFSTDAGNPLYPNLPGAEYEVLRALHLCEIAPEPIALLNTDQGSMLVYRNVDGEHWKSGTPQVAALLARLHSLKPNILLREIASGSEALMQQTEEILASCKTKSFRPQKLKTSTSEPPISHMSLIHTDVVASNLILTKSGLRLIDWQCPAFGDPCEDLASFLSPAMQYLYRGMILDPSEVESILKTYPDQKMVNRYKNLAPLFHLRIAAYCQWKADAGHGDYKTAAELELSAAEIG